MDRMTFCQSNRQGWWGGKVFPPEQRTNVLNTNSAVYSQLLPQRSPPGRIAPVSLGHPLFQLSRFPRSSTSQVVTQSLSTQHLKYPKAWSGEEGTDLLSKQMAGIKGMRAKCSVLEMQPTGCFISFSGYYLLAQRQAHYFCQWRTAKVQKFLNADNFKIISHVISATSIFLVQKLFLKTSACPST